MSTWDGESAASSDFAEELKQELSKSPVLKDISWHIENVDRVLGEAHCLFHAWELTPQQFVFAAKQLLAEGSLEENNESNYR